jgi:hypothetical protein
MPCKLCTFQIATHISTASNKAAARVNKPNKSNPPPNVSRIPATETKYAGNPCSTKTLCKFPCRCVNFGYPWYRKMIPSTMRTAKSERGCSLSRNFTPISGDPHHKKPRASRIVAETLSASSRPLTATEDRLQLLTTRNHSPRTPFTTLVVDVCDTPASANPLGTESQGDRANSSGLSP